MPFPQSYTGERTGIEAKAEDGEIREAYSVQIRFSEDVDGPLWPGIAGEEMLDLAEDLYSEDDPYTALYMTDGETLLVFPDGDEEKAEQIVEAVVENVDRYYDELGDAPLAAYLAEMPWDRE